MAKKRFVLIAVAAMCFGAMAATTAIANPVGLTSTLPVSNAVSPVNPSASLVFENEPFRIPANGMFYRVADITIADTDFNYAISSSAPVISSPGSFEPTHCGAGPKAYTVSGGIGLTTVPIPPPRTKIGELHLRLPIDADNHCFAFGAEVSVILTVIGPN